MRYVEISDAKKKHSEPMNAQIATFVLLSPVLVGGCAAPEWESCVSIAAVAKAISESLVGEVRS